MHDFVVARIAITIVALMSLVSCVSEKLGGAEGPHAMTLNPVSYFEIPVADLDRAIEFYEAVFSVSLDRTVIDGHEMALFPFDENGQGVSGALAKGESYVPSKFGPRIYFFVENIDETIDRAISKGGGLAYPKTKVGNFWVAEFMDSEGNLIALSSANE